MNNIIKEDCERIIKHINFTPLKGKNVLITGATGLLGQYVASTIILAAKDAGGSPRTIDCLSIDGKNKVLKELTGNRRPGFLKKDLAKPFTLPRKYDYIFHAAGYGQPAKFIKDPLAVVSVNVDATKEMLERFLSPRGKFVFFSSGDIYGDVPKTMKKIPESYNGNVSTAGQRAIYAESKRLGEAMIAAVTRGNKADGKIVRISHVYGPGVHYADSRVMSDFIRNGLEKKRIALMDEGRSIKTYGYVADVVEMIFFVALYGKDMIYNIGGTDTMSVAELARRVAKECRATVEIPSSKSKAAHVGSDPMFVKLDLSKVGREIKHRSFTPFKEGLARTIEWFKYIKKQN